MCGEFLERQKRVSVAAETKTNGVAKRGERDSVRDPEWRSGKQGLQGPRSEGSQSDLSGELLKIDVAETKRLFRYFNHGQDTQLKPTLDHPQKGLEPFQAPFCQNLRLALQTSSSHRKPKT